MYVGDTGTGGLHSLFFEILNSAINQALAGRATEIHVWMHENNSISVQDNGIGIPEQTGDGEEVSSIDLIMTKLNMSSIPNHDHYKVGWGLHGVGLACVNFLSAWFEAVVERNGKTYKMHYEKGIASGPPQIIEATSGHGTTIKWQPDPEIFGENKFRADIIRRNIQGMCYLTPEATIHFHDSLNQSASEIFHSEHSVGDLVQSLDEYQECIGGIVHSREVREDIMVDFALQFTALPVTRVLTFANNVHTGSGGTHFAGFQSGLRRAISSFSGQLGDGDGDPRYFTYGDVSQGVVAAVSIRHLHPRFEGSTRSRLGNEEVEGIVDVVVREAMGKFFAECPEVGQQIVERATDEQRKRRQKNGAKQQRNMTRRV